MHPLLAAILDDPTDTALRLIYADHLDEQGEADRAEFIRCQIELALPRPEDAFARGSDEWRREHSTRLIEEMAMAMARSETRRQYLRRRERELLLRRNLRASLWPFDALDPNPSLVPIGTAFQPDARRAVAIVARGFVERVTCTQALWIAHGAEIVGSQPVCAVTLSDREPSDWMASASIGFAWTVKTNNQVETLGDIGRDLFKCLRGNITSANTWWKSYETADEAKQALSHACVRWARAKAKLPELEVGT